MLLNESVARNAFLADIINRQRPSNQLKAEEWSYETAIAVASTQAYATIPNPYRQDPLIRLLAVRRSPWQIERIPEEERNYELYLTALSGHAGILKIVPKKFRTDEIFRIASCSNQLKDAYPYLPKSYRKHRYLALTAVTERGQNIAYVPGKTLDEEICRAAVASDPLALKKIPPHLRNYELCLSSVKEVPSLLLAVPDELLNEEIFSFVYQNPDPYKDGTTYGHLSRSIHCRWAEWQLQRNAR